MDDLNFSFGEPGNMLELQKILQVRFFAKHAYCFVFFLLFLLDQILTHHYAEKLLFLRLCFRNAKECAKKGETALVL